MGIYDISLTLTENMPVWPGAAKPQFERALKMEEGEIANVTHIKMSAHTGTHVDAPYHFLKKGKSVEHLLLEVLIGQAVVIESREEKLLTAKVLEKANIPPSTTRLLIKTRNSEQWAKGATEFDEDYVALSADGAEYLVDRGVQLVGVDYLSVAPFDNLVPIHEILLQSEVVIIEGLNLGGVEAGEYTLYCLPLKIAHADGAPARAILVK